MFIDFKISKLMLFEIEINAWAALVSAKKKQKKTQCCLLTNLQNQSLVIKVYSRQKFCKFKYILK